MMETEVHVGHAAEQVAWWDTNTTEAEAHGVGHAAEQVALSTALINLCIQQGAAFHRGSRETICVLSSQIGQTVYATTQDPTERARLFDRVNQIVEIVQGYFPQEIA